ncbi:MAG: hypothetical protein ACPGYJ_09340, partial [bacterium]
LIHKEKHKPMAIQLMRDLRASIRKRNDRKKTRPFRVFFWCGRGDLNPHKLCPLEPESSASTNSATSAFDAERS